VSLDLTQVVKQRFNPIDDSLFDFLVDVLEHRAISEVDGPDNPIDEVPEQNYVVSIVDAENWSLHVINVVVDLV
jgi:hypothetical protein